MLLPSSIQRAEDLVGIAIPMVGLVCASAPLPASAAAKAASINAYNVLFKPSMLHSPWSHLSSRRQVAPCPCYTRNRRWESSGSAIELGLWARFGLARRIDRGAAGPTSRIYRETFGLLDR